MKRLFSIALLAGLIAVQCLAVGISVQGHTADKRMKRLYLFMVQDERYGYVQPLDSFEVTDGKFAYQNDTLTTRLFFLSPVFNVNDMESCFAQGTYLFLAGGNNLLSVSRNARGAISADNPNVKLNAQYALFTHQKDSAGHKRTLDSLDQVFYAARNRNDQREMQRIKTSTAPIYNRAYEQLRQWLDKEVARHQGSPFGLYLYYTYRLQHANITNRTDLDRARQMVEGANDEAKQTWYYARATQKLNALEQTVVGQVAPPIVGEDKAGKALSLSHFKGKFVLVDFWSSSCTWCRKETPNLLRTFNAFKDQNFTILGVSTDFRKADWLKAIKEDGAIWQQLLLKGDARKQVLAAYSIVSIPQILLVSPDGTIIAKDLRGNKIYEAVQKALAK